MAEEFTVKTVHCVCGLPTCQHSITVERSRLCIRDAYGVKYDIAMSDETKLALAKALLGSIGKSA